MDFAKLMLTTAINVKSIHKYMPNYMFLKYPLSLRTSSSC